MKKILLSFVALAALGIAPALAADLPVRPPVYKAPMVTPPVYTWTGCYIGVGGGYKMWNRDHDLVDTPLGALIHEEGTSGGRGWLATGQVGCDYQLSGSWVIGAFGDYDWTDARGDFFGRPGGTSQTGNMKETSQWSAGGRLGYLVTPTLMTFVSGGWTQARVDATALFSASAPFASTGRLLAAHNRSGWFLGFGTEYNLPFFQGLTWKNEVRFAEYGSQTYLYSCVSAALCGTVGLTGEGDRSKQWQQSVRSELVWRFGAAPLRSAY